MKDRRVVREKCFVQSIHSSSNKTASFAMNTIHNSSNSSFVTLDAPKPLAGVTGLPSQAPAR